jgi:hypothetical protein
MTGEQSPRRSPPPQHDPAPATPQAGAACFDERPSYLAPDSGFILQPSSFTLSASGSTANPRPFRLRRASSSDVTGQARQIARGQSGKVHPTIR